MRDLSASNNRVDPCRVQFDEWVTDGPVQAFCQGCVCIGLLGPIMASVSKYEACLYTCEAASAGSGSVSESTTCDLLTVLLYVGHGVCVKMKEGSISER